MKGLPNNLERLELGLFLNNLGGNVENLRLLVEGMKNLPNNMKSLSLLISMNNLGENVERFWN